MSQTAQPAKLRCRLIAEDDLEAVARLLENGFGARQRETWRCGLERLKSRPVPDGAPRYGYCLDAGGALQGVILLIASLRDTADGPAPFTNVASWYVRPEYRAYAQMLVSMALKNKATSYINVSAAPHTWEIVEKQGYRPYCSGLFVALPALKRPAPGVQVAIFNGGTPDHQKLANFELLQRHAAWGCTALVCREGDKLTGLVLRRYTVRRGRVVLPAMLVIHAPDQALVVRYAGNVGRFLLPAIPLLIMDALGDVPELPGFYTERRGRKFVRGPHTPALGDLADTEFAIFGL